MQEALIQVGRPPGMSVSCAAAVGIVSLSCRVAPFAAASIHRTISSMLASAASGGRSAQKPESVATFGERGRPDRRRRRLSDGIPSIKRKHGLGESPSTSLTRIFHRLVGRSCRFALIFGRRSSAALPIIWNRSTLYYEISGSMIRLALKGPHKLLASRFDFCYKQAEVLHQT
jgi:hypothetical protein